MNPTEAALELEAGTLSVAEALGLGDDQVRLVYVETGVESSRASGELVQVDGSPDRHTLWRSVSGAPDDDIPL